MAYIYIIRNTFPGKPLVYIGQSSTKGLDRMWEHFDWVYPTNKGTKKSGKNQDAQVVQEMMRAGGLSDFNITIYEESENYGIPEKVFKDFYNTFSPSGDSRNKTKTWYNSDGSTEEDINVIKDKSLKLDIAEILHMMNAINRKESLVNTEMGGSFYYWYMNGDPNQAYQLYIKNTPQKNFQVFQASSNLLLSAQEIINKHAGKFIESLNGSINELEQLVSTELAGTGLYKDYNTLKKDLARIMGWTKKKNQPKSERTWRGYNPKWEGVSNDRLNYRINEMRKELRTLAPGSGTIKFFEPRTIKKAFKKTLAETIAANVIYQNQDFRSMFSSSELHFSRTGQLFTLSAGAVIDFSIPELPKANWWQFTPKGGREVTEGEKRNRALRYFLNILTAVRKKDNNKNIYNDAFVVVPSRAIKTVSLDTAEFSAENKEYPDTGFIKFTKKHEWLTEKVKREYVSTWKIQGTFLSYWDRFFAAMYDASQWFSHSWEPYPSLGPRAFRNTGLELPLRVWTSDRQDKEKTFQILSNIKLYGAYEFPADIPIGTLAITSLKYY